MQCFVGGVCVCVRSGRHSECSRLGAQWMGVRSLEGRNPTQDGQGPCTWPLHSHSTVSITQSPSSVPGMKRGHLEKPGSVFASHLHKYLLIVIKLNRNTQCTSGVRREFNLRYKRKVKLRVSVWVNEWVCRLWVCILHRVFGCLICLRWGEGLLLPLF